MRRGPLAIAIVFALACSKEPHEPFAGRALADPPRDSPPDASFDVGTSLVRAMREEKGDAFSAEATLRGCDAKDCRRRIARSLEVCAFLQGPSGCE